MFAKAVQKHDATVPPSRSKPATLAQQLFPSSSPTGPYNAHKHVFQKPSLPGKGLKPSSSSAANAARVDARLSAGNPLKRSASQANGLQSKDLEQTRNEAYYKSIADSIALSGDCGRSVSGNFQDAVDFDENDFPDDADIDLDFEDPAELRYLSAETPSKLSDPPLPQPQLIAGLPLSTLPQPQPTPGLSLSSAPIPWSSSPLQHKLGSLNAQNLQRQPPIDLTQDDEPKAKAPSKRRTLPWLEVEANAEIVTGPPAHVQDLINRQRKKKQRTSGLVDGSFTPLPKDKSLPWNKTASAVKEEQKKHRQQANQGKRLVKDAEDKEGNLVKHKVDRVRKGLAKVFLSTEQRRVLDLVVEQGKSVFFTGSAGTGKSVLMREIIKVLRDRHRREGDRVAVTASTGLAACNVGGVTLHSFAGIGLGKESVTALVTKIKKNSKAKLRWQRTKVLIIDEISMVDGELYDKLEAIARTLRNNGRPFGGIQLVITGDFFQLPPVPDSGKVATFAFDASTWETSIEHTIGLTQVFRQKDPSKKTSLSYSYDSAHLF